MAGLKTVTTLVPVAALVVAVVLVVVVVFTTIVVVVVAINEVNCHSKLSPATHQRTYTGHKQ